MLTTILMVFAFVLLLVQAFNPPVPRVSLGWIGLACWALAVILGGAGIAIR